MFADVVVEAERVPGEIGGAQVEVAVGIDVPRGELHHPEVPVEPGRAREGAAAEASQVMDLLRVRSVAGNEHGAGDGEVVLSVSIPIESDDELGRYGDGNDPLE